jgi:hypothetical protein
VPRRLLLWRIPDRVRRRVDSLYELPTFLCKLAKELEEEPAGERCTAARSEKRRQTQIRAQDEPECLHENPVEVPAGGVTSVRVPGRNLPGMWACYQRE